MTGKIVCALTLLILLAILSACEMRLESKPVATQPEDGVWVQRAMTSGPSLYHTCINGDRIYALQPLASRATHGLWPGASITAVKGGCRG